MPLTSSENARVLEWFLLVHTWGHSSLGYFACPKSQQPWVWNVLPNTQGSCSYTAMAGPHTKFTSCSSTLPTSLSGGQYVLFFIYGSLIQLCSPSTQGLCFCLELGFLFPTLWDEVLTGRFWASLPSVSPSVRSSGHFHSRHSMPVFWCSSKTARTFSPLLKLFSQPKIFLYHVPVLVFGALIWILLLLRHPLYPL